MASLETVPLVALGLRAIIGNAPNLQFVGIAETARGIIDLCRSERPEVLLVGSWADPQWKICQLLTNTFPGTAVVAIMGSHNLTPSNFVEARSHGARGLISVEAQPEQLVSAIRIVARGHYIDPALGVPMVQPGDAKTGVGNKPMSRREFEVLQLIAEGRTAEWIGKQLNIAPDTVRTHIRHILEKLHVRDRAHAVARAYEMSLLMPRTRSGVSPRVPAQPGR